MAYTLKKRKVATFYNSYNSGGIVVDCPYMVQEGSGEYRYYPNSFSGYTYDEKEIAKYKKYLELAKIVENEVPVVSTTVNTTPTSLTIESYSNFNNILHVILHYPLICSTTSNEIVEDEEELLAIKPKQYLNHNTKEISVALSPTSTKMLESHFLDTVIGTYRTSETIHTSDPENVHDRDKYKVHVSAIWSKSEITLFEFTTKYGVFTTWFEKKPTLISPYDVNRADLLYVDMLGLTVANNAIIKEGTYKKKQDPVSYIERMLGIHANNRFNLN